MSASVFAGRSLVTRNFSHRDDSGASRTLSLVSRRPCRNRTCVRPPRPRSATELWVLDLVELPLPPWRERHCQPFVPVASPRLRGSLPGDFLVVKKWSSVWVTSGPTVASGPASGGSPAPLRGAGDVPMLHLAEQVAEQALGDRAVLHHRRVRRLSSLLHRVDQG
jgi:hypothetical protein